MLLEKYDKEKKLKKIRAKSSLKKAKKASEVTQHQNIWLTFFLCFTPSLSILQALETQRDTYQNFPLIRIASLGDMF